MWTILTKTPASGAKYLHRSTASGVISAYGYFGGYSIALKKGQPGKRPKSPFPTSICIKSFFGTGLYCFGPFYTLEISFLIQKGGKGHPRKGWRRARVFWALFNAIELPPWTFRRAACSRCSTAPSTPTAWADLFRRPFLRSNNPIWAPKRP